MSDCEKDWKQAVVIEVNYGRPFLQRLLRKGWLEELSLAR